MPRGGSNLCHVRIASVSHPCCIRVVRIKSVSNSHHIRMKSAAMIICPSRSTFVRITSVRHSCRVCVTSLPYPCVNLHKDMPRIWHEYDKDNTDTGRAWHGGDTDLIRTSVRVRMSQNNRHGQIWPWRPWRTWHGCGTDMNRSTMTWYGHLSVSRPCVNPYMCKRSIRCFWCDNFCIKAVSPNMIMK